MSHFTTEIELILNELSNELSLFGNDMPTYIIFIFVFFGIFLFFTFCAIMTKLFFGRR